MFLYIFIGISVFILFILYIKLIIKKINNNNKKTNHYFIIVKNGQVKLEWIIRSININNYLRGNSKKITVFDLGSNDDSLAILERLVYPKRHIDYLYTNQSQLELKIEESKKNNEIPIILYVNSTSTSSK